MLSKKQRTMEVYEQAGAEMRLYKSLGARLATHISQVLSSTDTDKLLRIMGKINEICSKAEDNMFNDHPQLSNEYIDVFYGDTKNEPRNEVDKRIVQLAREAADDLFSLLRHFPPVKHTLKLIFSLLIDLVVIQIGAVPVFSSQHSHRIKPSLTLLDKV